jgi:tetratricopeptide (TPR) repeat protein
MGLLFDRKQPQQQPPPCSPCPGRRRSSTSFSAGTSTSFGGGSSSFSLAPRPNYQRQHQHHQQHHHRGLHHHAATTSSFGIGWSVGLNVERLEKLLCESIPAHLENATERKSLVARFKGLASRCRRRQPSSSSRVEVELDEAAAYMSAFLNGSISNSQETASSSSCILLPATLLVDLHSSIGLIREEIHGNTKAAIGSYVKALWILRRRSKAAVASQCQRQQQPQQQQQQRKRQQQQRSSRSLLPQSQSLLRDDKNTNDDCDLQQMAVLLYRLANSYGRLGDYDQMQQLMQQAQQAYYTYNSNSNNNNQNYNHSSPTS